MLQFELAHIGINCENAEEALKNAKLIQTMFGLETRMKETSVFAGTSVEFNKAPGRGTHGHIGFATPDVAAAVAEFEARGFSFIPESAKYKPDGSLSAIYFKDEICGFALHLMRMQ